MEVSHAPGIPTGLGFVSNGPTVAEVDNMDIDMDIDLGPIDDKELFPSVRGELSKPRLNLVCV